MNISLSSQTTLINPANNLVFALYDPVPNPIILLESQEAVKPYGDPLQITFLYNCLAGKVYLIKLWESADATPSGFIRNSLSMSAVGSSVIARFDEYLEADQTTGLNSGTNTYTNSSYLNWELSLERIGQGTMTPQSASIITDPKYKRTNADGSTNPLGPLITLLTPSDVFQPGEEFVVRFTPQVFTTSSPGAPSSVFGEGRIITTDTILSGSDVGIGLLIQSATNKITITLPGLESVPDFSFFYIYSNGGSHINAVIAANGSDKFNYNGNQSVIILGQCEKLTCFRAFGQWQVENDLPGVNKVGESLYSYSMGELNTILKNGFPLQRNVYPRLWAWVQQLESGSVVSDSAWTSSFVTLDTVTYFTKNGFYSSGDGSTTFRVPMAFQRTTKGYQSSPGMAENEQVLTHQHEETIGVLPTPLFGHGIVSRIVGEYKDTANHVADLTNVLTNPDGSVMQRQGASNLINSIFEYPLIRI